MKILAIEFSAELRSVAVVETGGGATRVLGVDSDASRDVAALRLVEQVLSQARCEREQIETIAVGLGPGSYTGIRAAIALAQGWQLASDGKVKLLGVSSAECLARTALLRNIFGTVGVMIDAQRGEFYFAVYEISAQSVRELKPLRIVGPEEISAAIQDGNSVVGPEVKRWFPDGVDLSPEAAVLAKMTAGRNDFVSGEKLEPIYLRQTSFVKAPPPRILS